MFTFIMSRVLRKCEERLSDLELLDVFEFGNAAILGPHIGGKYKDLGASYVDDCVFYATSSCPRNCVSKICAVASVVFDLLVAALLFPLSTYAALVVSEPRT